MAETSGQSAAGASTTPKLFVRQSSGLVRNVSVTNALFFNVAAFVGVGLTLYPIFYSLADVPVWRAGPFSAYGWAAIVAGLFCVLLALIFASLTSVMPRSGGDYVFSSRILHPFLGWLESWTLVIASVLIIAFEVPLVLRNLQITARIIGIGAGGFSGANGWFTDSTGCDHGHARLPRVDRRVAGDRSSRAASDAEVPQGGDGARGLRRRLLCGDVHLRPAGHEQVGLRRTPAALHRRRHGGQDRRQRQAGSDRLLRAAASSATSSRRRCSR